jgi:DNA-binding SARP family transcriptional activator
VAQLKISLLGAVRVERDGVPIEVDTRKAIALLAYLAMTGVPHRRDALAAFFWPEADDERARGALRRTLSALRGALKGDWLLVSRDVVELRRDSTVIIDVAEFRARLDDGRRRINNSIDAATQAIQLYRDDFMAGFSLRDSAEFDDWQAYQAEDLRRELGEGLELLVGCLIDAGEFGKAISYSRRWLLIDPLNEDAHRRLMLLYTWTGDRGAAVRQYRECVRILDQELGIAPLDETTALYQAIQRHEAPEPPMRTSNDARTAETAPVLSRLADVAIDQSGHPLVGRARELALLGTLYDQVQQDGRLVMVEGEAGVGKTYLVEAFLKEMRGRGAKTVVMSGYEGEMHLAYGPIVEGLRTLVEAEDFESTAARLPRHLLAELCRLVPHAASSASGVLDSPPMDGPGAQARFFEAVLQFMLATMSDERPGILFVDDIQWVDHASLDLLSYLVRRLRGHPMMVILGWRREDIAGGMPIEHLLAESERAGVGMRVTLARLGRADVRELVHAVLDAGEQKTDDRLVERLYRETEGLPFFLSEYLAVLGSELPLRDSSEWRLPRSIRDLVHARLAALDETERQLLTTAAIIGRPFDFEIVKEASGRSEDETVVGLESLLARGLIAEAATGAPNDALSGDYDFSHAKVREIVYEKTSLARRRLLHRRIAGALRTRSRGTPDRLATQLARHLLGTGLDAEAAEQFVVAGDRARSLYANAEALSHYQAALALGHPDVAALNEAIGDLQTLAGRYDEAFAAYETAATFAPGPIAGLEQKRGHVHLRLGQWQPAEGHFAVAERLLDAAGDEVDARAMASLLSGWSLAAHRGGDVERGWSLGQRALAFAEMAGDARERARAHNQLGILARARSDQPAARHHFEQSLTLAATLLDPDIRAAALNNLARVSFEAGKVEAAIALASEALDICIAQGDRHREAALYSNLADFLHAAGRRDEALGHVTRSAEIFAEINVVSGQMQPGVWKLVEW